MSALLNRTLLEWLVHRALPYWADHGVDRQNGGFYELLNRSGAPIAAMKRARLTARQIYCFSEGGRLGWKGPYKEIIQHGLNFLTRHLLRSDGSIVMATSEDGKFTDDRYDPYDYAFVLFSLAAAAHTLDCREELENLARRIAGKLISTWAHPEFGFEEAAPRTLPLKSNPQMHLLEAFLAWAESSPKDDNFWLDAAKGIAALALQRLVSKDNNAICEWYDGNWCPVSDDFGLQIEPGHQFEWAWLLSRWSLLSGDEAAFIAAKKLAEIGERHGIDPDREVAINAINEKFAVRDPNAKLWPQTERAKAWHILSQHPLNDRASRTNAELLTEAALRGCQKYIINGHAPIWNEVMRPDGTFIDEPVRASSFYHIVCAISTVNPPNLESSDV